MDPRAIEATQRFFQDLQDLLGEREGRVEVSPEGEGIYVNLTGPFRLIPEDEAFGAALGRIVHLHLRALFGENIRVLVDRDGQVAAMRRALSQRARDLARRAVAERRELHLEPMSPQDRRIVHLALAGLPEVRTYSVGRGQKRHVVIAPINRPHSP
jgi:predicted RNA-binding protein Jag